MSAAKSYLGAKNGSGVYQAIINLMPPHVKYIEAFLGTGAVMRKKAPALINIGLEKSPGAIDAFNRAAGKSFLPVQVLNCCAIEWLEQLYNQKSQFNTLERTLIYLDPPYVHSTRTSKARYEYELTDSDHRRLLRVIKRLAVMGGVNVMISGYRNSIYDSMLEGWFSKDFQAMTRGGVRTETVWCSFQPGEVHYHTYAGENYIERQRIKRKADRWAKRFAKMPPMEKQAVMSALLSIESNT